MEREFVSWLAERLLPHPLLKLGIGDDAAILSLADGDDMAVTTDLLADGVHFLTEEAEPEWIGRKCLAVNLSDLAAMAAEPVAAVISLVLPRSGTPQHNTQELAERLYQGLLPLAEEFGIAIAGGDTNVWDGRLAVSITAIGRIGPKGPLTRSGAKAGDHILVTGDLGGSIAGHHLTFTPRVREALSLHNRHSLHAAMDITDGLAIDLDRLIKKSGVGAVLDRESIPISASAEQLAAAEGSDALSHALHDGEDFELLIAAPPKVANTLLSENPVECGLTNIGQITTETGLWLQNTDGKQQSLEPHGYLH